MNVEENRLRTFTDWDSSSPISPVKLSKAGFYYTGNDYKVKCFSCGIEVSDWDFNDQVMRKHRIRSPECPFIINPLNSGNIPSNNLGNVRSFQVRLETFRNWPKSDIVSSEALAQSGFYFLNIKDYTKCAYCDVVLMSWEPGDDPETEHIRCSPNCTKPQIHNQETENSNLLINGTDLRDLGNNIREHKLPNSMDYGTYESRLCTFGHWPQEIRQKPEDLAQAGFYYEGIGDRVRCYHCNGRLNHWDPDDEPWSQHAYWFPNCDFVLLSKGKEFVERAASGKVDLNTSTPTKNSSNPTTRKSLSDRDLQDYLDSQQARVALNVGLQVDRIKQAVKTRYDVTGVLGFSSSDSLVEAALNLQLEDDDEPERACEQEPPAACRLSLEEENRQLKEARLCKICMDAEVAIVLLPCGHLTSCVLCAQNLTNCPLCRSAIKATVRTFLS